MAGAGLLFCLVTACFNVGFIATDDLYNGISIMIPAQKMRSWHDLAAYTHNPPGSRILLAELAHLGATLGLDQPVNQLRFALVLLCLFSFTINLYSALGHFRWESGIAKEHKQNVVVFLMGFYFALPLFYSRALVESISMPFLTASAFLACVYFASGKRNSLLGALTWLAVGSLFRYQLGLCSAVLFILPIIKKRYSDLLPLTGLAVLLFVLSGFFDMALTGGFHHSLRSYFLYNLYSAGADFGRVPFYTFLLLFLGLSLPPVLFSGYRNLAWKKEYYYLLPTLLYFLFFLVAHSLVPHKEERFMIPAIPLFLILVTPLAVYLWKVQRSRWRVWYFMVLNTVLLFSVSFNIPQNNIIGLALFMDRHPQYRSLWAVGNTLVVFPTAFIRREVPYQSFIPEKMGEYHPTCEELLAVRQDYEAAVSNSPVPLRKIAEFQPGWLEALIVRANPSKNYRRSAISLYTSCN